MAFLQEDVCDEKLSGFVLSEVQNFVGNAQRRLDGARYRAMGGSVARRLSEVPSEALEGMVAVGILLFREFLEVLDAAHAPFPELDVEP